LAGFARAGAIPIRKEDRIVALKLNVGVSRKVGLPDYGSVGASCNVELEVDLSLIDRDLDAFHARVRDVYVAAHQAVHDELARLQAPSSHRRPRRPARPRTARPPTTVTLTGRRPVGPARGGRPRRTRSAPSARSPAGSTPTSTGCCATLASAGRRTCPSSRRPSWSTPWRWPRAS